MKKYELTTTTTKVVNGVTLYQIRVIKDFSVFKVGDLGGWIEKESNLSQEDDCFIYGDACVYGNARVSGDARVYGNARVFGNACVFGNARVFGNACVFGNARVSGDARVYGDACVYGNACVSGDARVYGNAYLSAKMNYTKGRFIGGDDTGKITDITDKTGNNYWGNQYVLGDYEITPQEEEKKKVTLELTDEQLEQIKKIISI